MRSGLWRVEISVGADHDRRLPFYLELRDLDSGVEPDRLSEISAVVHNPPETIVVPVATRAGDSVVLRFPHYDSSLTLTVDDGGRVAGTFKKRRGAELWQELPVTATRVESGRLPTTEDISSFAPYLGSWEVDFASDDEIAIAVFREDDGRPWATIMTTTGDYRYLSAELGDGVVKLSCFDGAHLFLFRSSIDEYGGMIGDFWSGDNWHESYTAMRSDRSAMPDAFALTRWEESAQLSELIFPDLEGTPRALDDPLFQGEARILHVFGSWCPNCHDAAEYLTELEAKYGSRGLSIVGLAFELTGDFDRDAEQVRHYLTRHGSNYPVLIAGLADKDEATKSFPALDRVRSYPTTIFMSKSGQVRAVHTGFSGPATGAKHIELRERFEEIIEGLLESD